MLTGLGGPKGADPDVLMTTYVVAVHGIRDDCVMEAAGKFIRGDMQIEGWKPGRAPTTDVFTKACRELSSQKTAAENREKYKRIERKDDRPTTPEQRQRMGEKLRLLKEAIAGNEACRREIGWYEAETKEQTAMRIKYEDVKQVESGVTLQEFVSGCRGGKWPIGARYVAILQIVFEHGV